MKPEIKTITPKLAGEMLKGNTQNRHVNTAHVSRLAAAILAGEWKLNGDAIRFNGSKLIDGQHRLEAIIKAGKPVKSLVITDLAADVFDTIDIGKMRTGCNTLEAAGEKHCSVLASSLRVLHEILLSKPDSMDRLSNVEVMKGLGEHPKLRDSAAYIMGKKVARGLLTPAVACALHYLFTKKDGILADLFLSTLDDGSGLLQTDPIYWLRQRLLQNKMNAARLRRSHIIAITIKAWNGTRRGEKVKGLKWQQGEKFPIPQ